MTGGTLTVTVKGEMFPEQSASTFNFSMLAEKIKVVNLTSDKIAGLKKRWNR